VEPDRPIWQSGNQLLELCTSTNIGQCAGYVEGISDMANLSQAGKKAICMPPGTTPRQLGDVVIEYLRSNPENRQNSAASLVYIALALGFPCK
jgi:Rap1a immunity proteins